MFFFVPTCVLIVGSSLAVVSFASVHWTKSFVLYFNIFVCAKGLKGSALTNCSRGIHNAWHLYYALNLGIKVVQRLLYCVVHPLAERYVLTPKHIV